MRLDRKGITITMGAWAIAFVLCVASPLIRFFSGIPGSGAWGIYAAVGVMVVHLILIWKVKDQLWLAIDTSASAIASGGAFGFLLLGISTGRPLHYLLALKWALGAVFFTFLLRRQVGLSQQEELEFPDLEERIKGKSPDEIRAIFEADMAEVDRVIAELREKNRQQTKRSLLFLSVALVILATAYFMSRPN